MRKLTGLAFIVTGTVLFAFTTSGAGPLAPPKDEFIWTQAVASGRATWPDACADPRRSGPPRGAGPCAPGKWPLASQPLIAFNGDLWVAQHSHTAWHSRDGVNWTQAPSNGGWGVRYGMAQVFFKGHIYLMGGSTEDWQYRNDIWRSRDGVNWERITAAAPWSPRRWHSLVIFQDRLWLLGGADDTRTDGQRGSKFNDIWTSHNGADWTRVTEHAPWSAGGPSALLFRDRIWVVGAGEQREVWSSADGRQWTRHSAGAPWAGRMGHGVTAFAGRLWVLGGVSASGPLNDVWSSTDGVDWVRVTEHAPWGARAAGFAIVFQEKLWIFGGKDGQIYRGFYDDIWNMRAANHVAASAKRQ
jgi:hypothetical protein